jgi:DNA-directed RNA polymerase specialized sigma subunit
MDNLSDLELIENIKNKKDIDFCLQELIDRHSGIYLEMVNSLLRNCDNQSMRDDIISEKAYAIYNSALKYDESRGAKFSTFLGNEAKWLCLNASNKNKKLVAISSQNFDFSELKSEINEEKIHFEQDILDSFQKELENVSDERVKKIFRMRYSGNKKLTPWRKISEKMNLSIQGCINIHNSTLKTISKKIKSQYEIISQCSN